MLVICLFLTYGQLVQSESVAENNSSKYCQYGYAGKYCDGKLLKSNFIVFEVKKVIYE